MDRQQRRATLAGLMASVVLVAAGVTMSSAAQSRDGRCNPRKTVCATTTTSTSTTSTSTSTTSTTSTTVTPTDTTPPTAQIVSPTDGAAVASTLGVTGTSADDQQVARVELSIDGDVWAAAAGTTSWSVSVDTSSWAPGSHTLGVRAIDVAGNASAVSGVTVQMAGSTPGTGDPSVAPATQGTWTSPEGATIDVATAGAWTIRDIYRMLLENASAPGDFATIAPTLTVKVQDTSPAMTTSTARTSDGVFIRFSATVFLNGASAMFATQPDAQVGHEYGHVWTLFHLYMSQANDWSSYLEARWANADGSVRLGDDPRLGSSYTWDRAEIIGDDYRLLFGSANARTQRPAHLNPSIPNPADVPGLRDFFLSTWSR